MVEVLIDTCLCASLEMHNIYHGFRAGIGTVTDIMELKLAQDLASIDQDPIFLVFLDLRKAYDTVNRDCILITLEGYGAGPRLCGILETFWDCCQVVPRQTVFQVLAFPATRGTTQGRIIIGYVCCFFSLTLYHFALNWSQLSLDLYLNIMNSGKLGPILFYF